MFWIRSIGRRVWVYVELASHGQRPMIVKRLHSFGANKFGPSSAPGPRPPAFVIAPTCGQQLLRSRKLRTKTLNGWNWSSLVRKGRGLY